MSTTTQAGHTPTKTSTRWTYAADPFTPASFRILGPNGGCVCNNVGKHNAPLISAAPEMLKALEWAGKYIDSTGVPDDEQDNLNNLWAAIQKAKAL